MGTTTTNRFCGTIYTRSHGPEERTPAISKGVTLSLQKRIMVAVPDALHWNSKNAIFLSFRHRLTFQR